MESKFKIQVIKCDVIEVNYLEMKVVNLCFSNKEGEEEGEGEEATPSPLDPRAANPASSASTVHRFGLKVSLKFYNY